MRCIQCGHDSPVSTGYCPKCGGRLDLTANEIGQVLFEKARKDAAKETEYFTRQFVVFAIMLFLVAITISILSANPPISYQVPSATKDANFIKVEYKYLPPLEKKFVPFRDEWK